MLCGHTQQHSRLRHTATHLRPLNTTLYGSLFVICCSGRPRPACGTHTHTNTDEQATQHTCSCPAPPADRVLCHCSVSAYQHSSLHPVGVTSQPVAAPRQGRPRAPRHGTHLIPRSMAPSLVHTMSHNMRSIIRPCRLTERFALNCCLYVTVATCSGHPRPACGSAAGVLAACAPAWPSTSSPAAWRSST